MKKVLLAAPQQIRAALEKHLNATGKYFVVGTAHYREAIVEKTRELQPDIIIIQNSVKGSISFDEVAYEIKGISSNMRIVFISNEEDKELLSTLVLYGVYDIVVSTSLSIQKLFDILDNPRTIQDVLPYTRDNTLRKKSREAAAAIIEEGADESQPQKASVLGGLFGKKKEKKVEPVAQAIPPSKAPVNEQKEVVSERTTEGMTAEESLGEPIKGEDNTAKGSVEEILGEKEVFSPNREDSEPEEKKENRKPVLSTNEKYDIIKKAASGMEENALSEEEKELLTTAEEYADTCKSLFSKTETIKEKIRDLREEKSRLHTKMLDAKDDCYDLEKEVELLRKQLDEKQASLNVNPEKRADLERQIKELTEALSEIKSGSDFLEKKLAFLTASKRLYLFLDENIPDDESPEVYEKVISAWKEECTDLKLSTSEMREEIVKLNSQLSEAEQEKLSVNNSLLSVKHNLQKVTNERDLSKEELLDTENALEGLELELKELNSKKKGLQQKIETLNDSLNEEIKTISGFENLLSLPESTKAGDAIKSLNAEIKTLRAEVEELSQKEDSQEISEETLQEIKKKNEEIENLKSSLHEAERELGQRPSVKSYELLESERDELKEEVFNLQSQMDTLSDQSLAIQEAEKSIRENAFLKNENKVFLEEIAELEDRIEELEQKNIEIKKIAPVPREETSVLIDGNVYTNGVIRPKRTLLPFGKQNSFTPNPPNGRKIFAFVGAKQGIGNTYTALNVASLLAKNSKVLFIEFDEVNPLSSYLFAFEQMGAEGNLLKGVEKGMVTTKTGKYSSISDQVISPKDVPIPKSLHFLTYSQEHLMGLSNNLNMLSGFDELFRRIKIEQNYDYIVADFPAAQNVATSELLSGRIYVDAICMCLTQDVHTIACADKKADILLRISERMGKEINYLLLDYNDDCKVNITAISNWLNTGKNKIFPIVLNKGYANDCIYEGEMYALIGDGYKPFEEIVKELTK